MCRGVGDYRATDRRGRATVWKPELSNRLDVHSGQSHPIREHVDEFARAVGADPNTVRELLGYPLVEDGETDLRRASMRWGGGGRA
jgi:hypothetical protein